MTDESKNSESLNRYHRQMLLPGIGGSGQQKLQDAHALVVGCGALGSVIIDSLARAGVGTLTIVDRDVVELTNLQRQILYEEADVRAGTPKAVAAKERLSRINSEITIHAHVDDFSHRNAQRFSERVDIIVDGLDNFETRYLLNDLAVSKNIPYIYGGAVGTSGVSMAVLPHDTPCLRCVFPEAPPPGISPTCDTAGVLGPIVTAIAAHQAAQTIKILSGNVGAVDRSLLSIDVWNNETRRFDVSGTKSPQCVCCGQRRFEFLYGHSGSAAVSLCGRNAVQITPAHTAPIDLSALTARLAPHGRFTHNEYLLRGEFHHERNGERLPIELTLFDNGRAIIKGVTEPDAARAIYAKYIGA